MTELAGIKVYYPEDVSKLLGITLEVYNKKCRLKEIPAKKMGKKWIITETKLNDFLNKR